VNLYRAVFDTEQQAIEAQRKIEPMFVARVSPQPYNRWLLTVSIPDDGSGSMHVNPEQFDMVVEAVLEHGGRPVAERTARSDTKAPWPPDGPTHHLIPRSGVPTCRYCKKTRSELEAKHDDPEVTHYACPDAPR
jgi:hypothetical protein